MVVSTSEDISPTCPCEDPTLGTIVAIAVAYTALVDQHIVPSEGMDDRMPDLLPWEGLLPVRHLGQQMDVALLLSSECLPSTVSCMFPTFEETLDACLLVSTSKCLPDVCTYSKGGQKLAWP
jgi:hypothetical protein